MKNGNQITNLNIEQCKGTTVLELINTFKEVNKVDLPYSFLYQGEGDQKYSSRQFKSSFYSKLGTYEDFRGYVKMDGTGKLKKNPKGYID